MLFFLPAADDIAICICSLQSPTGDEAYNENGLVPRAIRLLKDKFPDLVSIISNLPGIGM